MNSKIVIVCSFTFLLCNSHSSAQDVRAATYQWIQDDSFVLVDNILKLYVDSALDLQRSSVIMSFDGGGHVLDLYSSESVEPGITCHIHAGVEPDPSTGPS
jgi:hypothetical protein